MAAERYTQPTSQAAGTDTPAKAEDTAHASGDVGIMVLAVRADTAAALAGTTGDYIPLMTDSTGRLHISQPIDELSGAIETITDAHHHVHEGEAFVADFTNSALGDTETINICFKTPVGTKRANLVGEFTSLVGGEFEIWEGPTWTTGSGNTQEAVNRFRKPAMTGTGMLEDKTATPSFTATNNVLIDTLGLNTTPAMRIHHWHAWGKKEKISAGGARDTSEIILKPDTTYAALFTAVGASNKAQIVLNWYEHTDSN